MKIIANPYAIKLSQLDSTISTASDVYKGVQVLPGITGKKGTFGATYDADKLCHYIDTGATPPVDKAICSTNSGDYYINYTDASSSTDGKQYLYN